jgi:hypothetical protein
VKQHRQRAEANFAQHDDLVLASGSAPANSVIQAQMSAREPSMLDSFLGLFGGEPELDEATLADREAASAELSSMFKIVENEADVDGNAVTQEQFEQIVANYSDIRMGKTNIQFGSGAEGQSAEEFKGLAMKDLARMMQTKSGRELLDHAMHATDKDGKALKTTIQHGEEPEAEAMDKKRAMNGKGSNATIHYRPGQDTPTEGTGASWGDHHRSDVALYHEFVHAKHMHDGELSTDRDTEEMNTVGMGRDFNAKHFQYFENRYRHERRMIGQGDTGVVEGDRGMAQRDNFKGGEGQGGDYVVPYDYATDRHTPGIM